MIQRSIDIFLSLTGIIMVLPFLPIVAMLIKIDSKGPVFYLCDRVGKDKKLFKMFKLRTMVNAPIEVGGSICPQYDPRVTPLGRFLRRTKLNEFPQLINILMGDMTFVGPRPEALDLANLYPEEAQRVFSVKPGLVGPNQILKRNEEELYPPGVDEKKYYIEEILPSKLQIDLGYINNTSIFKNLKFIFLGVMETLTGAISKKYIQRNRSQIYLLLSDLGLSLFSYGLSLAVVTGFSVNPSHIFAVLFFLPLLLAIRICCAVYFGLYNTLIRYISSFEIIKVFKAVAGGTIMIVVLTVVFKLPVYNRAIAVIDGCLLALLLSCLRVGLQFSWERRNHRPNGMKPRNVLIYGAGRSGRLAYKALALAGGDRYHVVGFIDDAPEKYGKTLHGCKVLGNHHHLVALTKLYHITEVILALSHASSDDLTAIVDVCRKAGVRYRLFTCADAIDSGCHMSYPVRELGVADILPLKRISMDRYAIQPLIAGKTVLVNGSGGALGLELCREILHFGCSKLIIVDRFESHIAELITGLRNGFAQDRLVTVLTDAQQLKRLEQAFLTHRPDMVFHAGMRKYASIVEIDEDSITRINYEYTFNLAKLAADYGCTDFVLFSSTAAGNGCGFISDSLRIAERSLQEFFNDRPTRLIVARLCDILENRGSLMYVIENQIKARDTVTLPTQKAPVHLLSKQSAVQFILQTLVEADRQDCTRAVFVCDAEPAIDLKELVKKTAIAYGLRVGVDVPVRYSDSVSKSIQHLISESLDLIPTQHEAIKLLKEDDSSHSKSLCDKKLSFGRTLTDSISSIGSLELMQLFNFHTASK